MANKTKTKQNKKIQYLIWGIPSINKLRYGVADRPERMT